jgi:hypothetical protein
MVYHGFSTLNAARSIPGLERDINVRNCGHRPTRPLAPCVGVGYQTSVHQPGLTTDRHVLCDRRLAPIDGPR